MGSEMCIRDRYPVEIPENLSKKVLEKNNEEELITPVINPDEIASTISGKVNG